MSDRRSPTAADAASAALFGDFADLADLVEATNPAAAKLLREPDPFGKPQKLDRWARAVADNWLMRRDLGVKCPYARGVALDAIYKFTPEGGYSSLRNRIALGQLDNAILARGAEIIEAMTPRYRKQRLEMLRSLVPTSPIRDVDTENEAD